ncbi:hypothetical protein [Maricaulis sp.]|uniref:hypothetical protein n=1 Tax=Maricaulis sp. TaxID=1486257 RepID=UPI001B0415FA|nr:hypothetical protein [Maricaulis sp.]MBO6798425.1 hypothetical protein [Maricaulis sp.]
MLQLVSFVWRAAKTAFLTSGALVAVWIILYPALLFLGAASGSPITVPFVEILRTLPVLFFGIFGLILIVIIAAQIFGLYRERK